MPTNFIANFTISAFALNFKHFPQGKGPNRGLVQILSNFVISSSALKYGSSWTPCAPSAHLHDAPHVLVHLEPLQQRRLAARWGHVRHYLVQNTVILLAHGALPHPLLAVELEVGLQVEALDVSALVASGRHRDPPEGQGAAQAHLKKRKKYFQILVLKTMHVYLFMDVHNHNSH